MIYFIADGSRKKLTAFSLLFFIICGFLGNSDSFAFWEKDLTYEGESVYNYLQVRDTEQSTVLSTNVLFGVQSIYMKQNKLTGMYYDYALAAPVMANMAEKDKPSMLVLGMGTGTYALESRKYLPQNPQRPVRVLLGVVLYVILTL